MDSKTIFLVDLNSKSDSALLEDRITALRQLFESETVAKIIHDCRMDCDALYHLHNISLNNIHDTSCFHGTSDIGLNDLLAYHGLSPNVTRDGSVYGANPKFWATRPMTSQMKQWASADVEKLLLLADRQLQRLDNDAMAEARHRSQDFARVVVDMDLAEGVPLRKSPGLFIGSRGANLRALQKRTGTMIYKDYNHGGQTAKVWLVFYPNVTALDQVKRAME